MCACSVASSLKGESTLPHVRKRLAVLRTEQAAKAYRVRKTGFQTARRKRGVREDARKRNGKRGGNLFALCVVQRGETAHLNRQPRRVTFAAVMQGLQLVFQRAVRVAGIPALCRQGMRIDKRVKGRIRGIMREKAAAVGAKQRVACTGFAQSEQKVVRLLRVQQRTDQRRKRFAGRKQKNIGSGPSAPARSALRSAAESCKESASAACAATDW